MDETCKQITEVNQAITHLEQYMTFNLIHRGLFGMLGVMHGFRTEDSRPITVE